MELRIPDIEQEKNHLANNRENMTAGSMDDVFLKQLNAVVEENLGNERFTVEELAETVAYSRSQLHRKIQKLTNQSVSQYIRNIRLQHGMGYLEQNVGTVSEIAFKVGFSSSTYFIKCFSERYGVSPGEVRRKVESNEQFSTPKDDKNMFEALHPGTSDGLVRELFEHLVLFNPELQASLQEENGQNRGADIRVLAFEIIKSFPWPIAIELRRLFSGSMKELNYKRLVQLKRANTRILDFFTYILLSELINELSRNDLQSDLKQACKWCMEEIKLANQVALFKKAQPLIINGVVAKFVKELDHLFDDSFFRELEQWVEIERTSGDLEIDEACSILEQSLIFFIKKAAFLSRYQLVNVSSIKVSKLKFRTPVFEHHLHLLNSVDNDFKVQEETLDQFSDSNAVLLVKNVSVPTQFINLSPFVIDTHSEYSKDQKQKVKRDVYLFKRFDGSRLHYVGSEVMSTVDLSEMASYEKLENEYNDALKILNQ